MSDSISNEIANTDQSVDSSSQVTESNVVDTKKRSLEQLAENKDELETSAVTEDNEGESIKKAKIAESEVTGDGTTEPELTVKTDADIQDDKTVDEESNPSIETGTTKSDKSEEATEYQAPKSNESDKSKHTFGCSSFGSFAASLTTKNSTDPTAVDSKNAATESNNTISNSTTTSSSSGFSFGSGLAFGGSAFGTVPKKNIFESDDTKKEEDDTKTKSTEVGGVNSESETSSSTTGKFSFGSGLAFGSSFGNVISGLPKKDNPWSEAKTESNDEEDSEKETLSVEDTSKDDLYVKVDKPLEKKTVETGEEDEKSVFTCRSKLYALNLTATNEGWKERGVGTIHVNTKEVDGVKKSRVIMRSDGLLRVILNAPLLEKFEVMKGMTSSLQSEKFVRITAFEDGKPFQYALKTGNKNTANELYDIIHDLIPN